ncbi:MAG: LysM peptidoglycan-binding domain-containing protein [Aestuariibaculum sp.]
MIKYLFVLGIVLLSFNMANAQKFSTHQVKEGETVYSLAKQYYVTVDEIYELNPDAKKGLKPHTILIIPVSKSTKPETATTSTVKTTKTLQGYETHKVRRKETLYSLSKRYNISEEEIKKNNRFLYANNLRKGDKLKIPIYKVTETVEEVKTTKTYTVLPKEGKWRVAYKFGITLDELEALNPDMGETLKVGQQINVPNIASDEIKVVDEQYSYYTVLPKEGFYRLKVKLNLTQDELETLNPGLSETGLKDGMILKIPFSNNKINGQIDENNTFNTISLSDKHLDRNTKHIAVMLPFRLNRVEYDSVDLTQKSIEKDPYLDASLDFYSGILHALDSLKTLGISVKVDVYDTEYQVSKVSEIINKNDFSQIDAVIGPLTSATFTKVAEELRTFNTPVVSPIGTKLKLSGNVFQSRPADNLLRDKVVNYVKADSLFKNIIIISDSKSYATANLLKQEFSTAKSVYSRKDKKTGKDANYVLVDDIKKLLNPGKNMVFIETQDEGFASNVTSILASLSQKSGIEIVLATTNFNSAFEGDAISNEHLSRLQFHYASTSKSFNNSNSPFIKSYQKKHGVTPNKRAVRGFDLTMDIVLRLATSNDLYTSASQPSQTEYVENKFAYKKELFGGYYNTSVYLLKYDNLMVIEEKTP